jgi:hypothetical protein
MVRRTQKKTARASSSAAAPTRVEGEGRGTVQEMALGGAKDGEEEEQEAERKMKKMKITLNDEDGGVYKYIEDQETRDRIRCTLGTAITESDLLNEDIVELGARLFSLLGGVDIWILLSAVKAKQGPSHPPSFHSLPLLTFLSALVIYLRHEDCRSR